MELFRKMAGKEHSSRFLGTEDKLMLNDLKVVGKLVSGPIMMSKALWEYLNGPERFVSYATFRKLVKGILQSKRTPELPSKIDFTTDVEIYVVGNNIYDELD